MKHLIAGLAAIWAGGVGAQNSTPAYDELVLEALTTATAEQKQFAETYPAYMLDALQLLETGTYVMSAPNDAIFAIEAELVGIYDDTTRTFTWGWASDRYPLLERTAADAVRSYGRANKIPELTSPRAIGGATDAKVRSSVATVLGDLDLVAPVPSGDLTIYVGLANIRGSGS